MRISATAAELRSGETASLLPWRASLTRLFSPAVQANPGLHGQVTVDRSAYARGEARYLVPVFMPEDNGVPQDGGKYIKCHFYQPPAWSDGASGLTERACQFAFAINAEMDGDLDEQLARVNALPPELEPTLVAFSGGKSLHVFWALRDLANKDRAKKLRRYLALLIDGDLQLADSPIAGARLPGWGGERSQPVLFVSDAVYTTGELEAVAEAMLAERGIDPAAREHRAKLGSSAYLPSDDPAFAGLKPGMNHRRCPWCGGKDSLSVWATRDGVLAASCYNPKCAGDKKCHTRYAEPSVTTEQVKRTKTTKLADVDALFADAPQKAEVEANASAVVSSTLSNRDRGHRVERTEPRDVARRHFRDGMVALVPPAEVDSDLLNPLGPEPTEEQKQAALALHRDRLGKGWDKFFVCKRGRYLEGVSGSREARTRLMSCGSYACEQCGPRLLQAAQSALVGVCLERAQRFPEAVAYMVASRADKRTQETVSQEFRRWRAQDEDACWYVGVAVSPEVVVWLLHGPQESFPTEGRGLAEALRLRSVQGPLADLAEDAVAKVDLDAHRAGHEPGNRTVLVRGPRKVVSRVAAFKDYIFERPHERPAKMGVERIFTRSKMEDVAEKLSHYLGLPFPVEDGTMVVPEGLDAAASLRVAKQQGFIERVGRKTKLLVGDPSPDGFYDFSLSM